MSGKGQVKKGQILNLINVNQKFWYLLHAVGAQKSDGVICFAIRRIEQLAKNSILLF